MLDRQKNITLHLWSCLNRFRKKRSISASVGHLFGLSSATDWSDGMYLSHDISYAGMCVLVLVCFVSLRLMQSLGHGKKSDAVKRITVDNHLSIEMLFLFDECTMRAAYKF